MPRTPDHARLAPRPRGGVTLIEILIVIVLIGILAGITATKLDWMRYRAESVARGAMAELSQAQRTAVSLQTDVRVTSVAADRFRIHEDANNNGAMDGGERITFLVLEPGFTIGRGTLPVLPAPAAGTELSTVIFRRDGTASTSGAFYLRGPTSDATCHYCRALEVARATGRVVIFSYATGAWARGN